MIFYSFSTFQQFQQFQQKERKKEKYEKKEREKNIYYCYYDIYKLRGIVKGEDPMVPELLNKTVKCIPPVMLSFSYEITR